MKNFLEQEIFVPATALVRAYSTKKTQVTDSIVKWPQLMWFVRFTEKLQYYHHSQFVMEDTSDKMRIIYILQ